MPRRKPQKNNFPVILIALGGLLILTALVGFALQSNQSAAAPTAPASAAGSLASMKRISLADAKSALDQGKAVFLDVRGTAVFAESHIPGARLIPSTEIENRWNELNKNDWIITYCT